jgi:hypothetical protein
MAGSGGLTAAQEAEVEPAQVQVQVHVQVQVQTPVCRHLRYQVSRLQLDVKDMDTGVGMCIVPGREAAKLNDVRKDMICD